MFRIILIIFKFLFYFFRCSRTHFKFCESTLWNQPFFIITLLSLSFKCYHKAPARFPKDFSCQCFHFYACFSSIAGGLGFSLYKSVKNRHTGVFLFFWYIIWIFELQFQSIFWPQFWPQFFRFQVVSNGLKRHFHPFLSIKKPPKHHIFSGFTGMDLRGIEPLSESSSIKASPITVILLTFPP